jgi:hypothetical protein
MGDRNAWRTNMRRRVMRRMKKLLKNRMRRRGLAGANARRYKGVKGGQQTGPTTSKCRGGIDRHS